MQNVIIFLLIIIVYYMYYVAELQTICREYHTKIARLESDKYDLELIEQIKKLEVTGFISKKTFSSQLKIKTFLRVYFFLFIFIILIYYYYIKLKQKKNNIITYIYYIELG